MKIKKSLAILIVGILAIGFFSQIVFGKEVKGTSENKSVHLNMKAGSKLSPMMPGDGEKKRVKAKYDDYGLIRVNRKKVDIGTWTSKSLVFKMDTSGEANFNLWVANAEGNERSDNEFWFTLKKNEEEIGKVHIDNQRVSDKPTLITASTAINATNFQANDKISLYLEYEGWDDIDVYYDNFTYNSGVQITCNPITIYGVSATKKEISLEFIDSFDIDWTESPELTKVKVGGQVLDVEPEVKDGEERETANGTITTKLLVWIADQNLESGASVKVSISYDGGNVTWETSGEVGKTTIGGWGSIGKENNSNDKYIYACVGVIVVGAIVGVVIIKKRRE